MAFSIFAPSALPLSQPTAAGTLPQVSPHLERASPQRGSQADNNCETTPSSKKLFGLEASFGSTADSTAVGDSPFALSSPASARVDPQQLFACPAECWARPSSAVLHVRQRFGEQPATSLLDGWAAGSRFREVYEDLIARRRKVYRLEDLHALAVQSDQAQQVMSVRMAELEADLHDAKRETGLWRQRCQDSELSCQTVAAAERRAQLELKAGQDREELITKIADELRRDRAEAEARASESQATASALRRRLKSLEDQIQYTADEFNNMHSELQRATSKEISLKREMELAECGFQEQLRQERVRHEDAQKRLNSRMRTLEDKLTALTTQDAETTQRADKTLTRNNYLEARNGQLEKERHLLSLQVDEAIAQGARFGVSPVYLGSFRATDESEAYYRGMHPTATARMAADVLSPSPPKTQRASSLLSPKEAIMQLRASRIVGA